MLIQFPIFFCFLVLFSSSLLCSVSLCSILVFMSSLFTHILVSFVHSSAFSRFAACASDCMIDKANTKIVSALIGKRTRETRKNMTSTASIRLKMRCDAIRTNFRHFTDLSEGEQWFRVQTQTNYQILIFYSIQNKIENRNHNK